MIAVKSPRSGSTPDAIAKAIANGSATMPTIIPAVRSFRNVFDEYFFNVLRISGLNIVET